MGCVLFGKASAINDFEDWGERMNTWQIGTVKITRVIEMETTGGSRFILPDATRDACKPIGWMQPHFMDEQGNLIMSVHALIVDTGKYRIVLLIPASVTTKSATYPPGRICKPIFCNNLQLQDIPESQSTMSCVPTCMSTMWVGILCW